MGIFYTSAGVIEYGLLPRQSSMEGVELRKRQSGEGLAHINTS